MIVAREYTRLKALVRPAVLASDLNEETAGLLRAAEASAYQRCDVFFLWITFGARLV
jgi:hypothetical protein